MLRSGANSIDGKLAALKPETAEMTDVDIAAAKQWIERLRGDLAEHDRDPRDEQGQRIAAGIREEIARVERLVCRARADVLRELLA